MTTPGRPLTKARSEWIERDDVAIGGATATIWSRNVGDGVLAAIVALEPMGWHVSISFRDHRGRKSRYPRWDEIAEARYRFMPHELTVAMLLPPPEEYVALHETTFHLHELKEGQ